MRARVVAIDDAVAARRLPVTPDRVRTMLDSRDQVATTLLDGERGERRERSSGEPAAGPVGAPTPAA